MGRDGIIFATPGLTFGILVKGSRGRVACANACSHARKRSDGHYSLGSDAGACIYLLSITRQGHGDDGEQQQEYVLSKSLDSSRRPLNILTSGHSLIPVTSAARQSRQGTSLRETADISGERCNEVHLEVCGNCSFDQYTHCPASCVSSSFQLRCPCAPNADFCSEHEAHQIREIVCPRRFRTRSLFDVCAWFEPLSHCVPRLAVGPTRSCAV
jgi:hypothetical protein